MCDLFADEPPPGRCDECSPRCRSLQHCHLATAAVTKASDDELISYLSWVCHNAPTAVDSFGRSVLHMAASCGRHKLVRWLVEVHGASVNGVDSESGMTALHRSVFYGHLNIARTLISLGASEMTIDAAGLNVYDCIHEDLPAWVGSADVRCPCHVFVWGDNTWYSVGVSRANAPRVPLMLDVFPRAGLWVCQVYMSKFHSVFVCQSGEVFTCGHGVGGRLGLGREESVLSPTQVRCVSGERCCQAAVSSEHTVLLMDSGTVWTCGLNDCYQLCQGVSASGTTIPVRLLAARSVDWSRHRPDRITGVAAARYHTVLWNAESLYCAGLNAGQMGHHKDETKDKRFLTPRKVTMIERGGCDAVKLTHVVCCDAATVAATASGSIFLLSEYRCRKITSRMLNLRTVSVIGGLVDTGVLNGLSISSNAGGSGGGGEVCVAVLSAVGALLIWRQSHPTLTRYTCDVPRGVSWCDVAMSARAELLLCSDHGQIFTARLSLAHPSAAVKDAAKSQKHAVVRRAGDRQPAGSTTKWHLLHVVRVAQVHRAVGVTCDVTGANMATLQYDARTFLLEVPHAPPSSLSQDMTSLLESATYDSLHDVILKTPDGQRVPAHRFILCASSGYFRKLWATPQQAAGGNSSDTCASQSLSEQVVFVPMCAATLRHVLMFVYAGTCDLLRPGVVDLSYYSSHRHGARCAGAVSSSVFTAKIAVHLLREAAKFLGIASLHKCLEAVDVVDGCIELSTLHDITVAHPPLDRLSMTSLYDVTLATRAEDVTVAVRCHKCVLCARLDYFRAMLDTDWVESDCSTERVVRLPFSGAVLHVVVDFCYTDSLSLPCTSSAAAPSLSTPASCETAAARVDLLCSVLVAADQVLSERLKQLAEVEICDDISLKNCAELLEFGVMYNCHQLTAVCCQFVCLNLATLMENRSLDVLSEPVMETLADYYRRLNPAVSSRHIVPYSGSPSAALIHRVHEHYPVCWDELGSAQPLSSGSSGGRRLGRRRTTSRRSESICDGTSSDANAFEGREGIVPQTSRFQTAADDVTGVTSSAAADLTPAHQCEQFCVVTRRRSQQKARADHVARSVTCCPTAETSCSSDQQSKSSCGDRGVGTGRYIPGLSVSPRVRCSDGISIAASPSIVETRVSQLSPPPPLVPQLLDVSACGATVSSETRRIGSAANAEDFPALSSASVEDSSNNNNKNTGAKNSNICIDKKRHSRASKKSGRRGRTLPLAECVTSDCDVTLSCPISSRTASMTSHNASAWNQTVPPADSVACLADIIDEQLRVAPSTKTVNTAVPVVATEVLSSLGATDNISGGGAWRRGGAECGVDGVASLVDIINEQRRSNEAARQRRNKSLHLIQIEELAAAQLTAHYRAMYPDDSVAVSVRIVADTS